MADRKIHINEEEWKYRIGSQYVVILSPNGKRYNVSIGKLWFSLHGVYPETRKDGKRDVKLSPSVIKTYIEKELR